MAKRMKKLMWLPQFLYWGQYFNRGDWRGFLLHNGMGVIGFLFVFFIFNGGTLLGFDDNGTSSAFSYVVFLLAISGTEALAERHNDEGIRYRLAETNPMSYGDVSLMRVIARCIAPSTFIGIIVLFFNFHLRDVSLGLVVMATIVTFVFSHVLEDLYAFVSMDLPNGHPLSVLLWGTVVACFFGAYKIQLPLTWPIVLSIAATSLLFIGLLLLLMKYKRTRTKHLTQNKRAKTKKQSADVGSLKSFALSKGRAVQAWHSRSLVHKRITRRRMLLYKECLFLFRHKPGWIFNALWFFSMGTAGIRTEFSALALLFNTTIVPLHLASDYASNYLGLEAHDLLPVMISPVASKSLIRGKTTMFVFISLLSASVVTVLQTIGLVLSFAEMARIFGGAILFIAPYAIIINYSSIKYYGLKEQNMKFSAIRFCITFGAFIGIHLFILGISLLPQKNMIAAGAVVLSVALATFLLVIKPNYFSDMYEDKREHILRELSKPIKKKNRQT